jgi:hypothetical protein
LSKLIPLIILLMLSIQDIACSPTQKQAVSANVAPSQQESAQQILAMQPDFVADQFYASFETRGHGHSYTFQVAKKGEWYRSASDMTAAFSSYAEPNVRYFLQAKTFDSPPRSKEKRVWYLSAQTPAILAQEHGVVFETIGEEAVDGHNCIKIRVTNPTEHDEVTAFLYAAKDLKNLVIRTELTLPDRRTTFILKNISFDVPDSLFKVLARRPKANI